MARVEVADVLAGRARLDLIPFFMHHITMFIYVTIRFAVLIAEAGCLFFTIVDIIDVRVTVALNVRFGIQNPLGVLEHSAAAVLRRKLRGDRYKGGRHLTQVLIGLLLRHLLGSNHGPVGSFLSHWHDALLTLVML